MVLNEAAWRKVVELQKYLLAGFISEWGIEEFGNTLRKEYFWAYKDVFQFLKDYGNEITPDFTTVVWPYFMELSDWSTGTFATSKYRYARELIRLFYKDKLSSEWVDETILFKEMQENLHKLDEIAFGSSLEWDLSKHLLSLETEIEEYRSWEKVGWKTWLNTIDKYIDGLIKWKVYLLSAYSNTGKSKLSYFITNNALRQGAKVAYFSLEVTASEALLNLTSNYYWVDYSELQKWNVEVDFGEYANLQLKVYDSVLKMDEIERIVLSTSPDVVVVDYAQLVRVEWAKEYEQLNDYSRRMKILSKKAKCAIFHLSQVANDSVKYVKGGTIPAKGSGELVAAADVVFVMQPDTFGGLELHIAKHRYWQKGAMVGLTTNFARAQFIDEWELFE